MDGLLGLGLLLQTMVSQVNRVTLILNYVSSTWRELLLPVQIPGFCGESGGSRGVGEWRGGSWAEPRSGCQEPD